MVNCRNDQEWHCGLTKNIRGDSIACQSWRSPFTGQYLQQCLLSDYVESIVGGAVDAGKTVARSVFLLLFSLPFLLPLPLTRFFPFLSHGWRMSGSFWRIQRCMRHSSCLQGSLSLMEEAEVKLEKFINIFCIAWKILIPSQDISGVWWCCYINKCAVIFINVKRYVLYLISSIFRVPVN